MLIANFHMLNRNQFLEDSCCKAKIYAELAEYQQWYVHLYASHGIYHTSIGEVGCMYVQSAPYCGHASCYVSTLEVEGAHMDTWPPGLAC